MVLSDDEGKLKEMIKEKEEGNSETEGDKEKKNEEKKKEKKGSRRESRARKAIPLDTTTKKEGDPPKSNFFRKLYSTSINSASLNSPPKDEERNNNNNNTNYTLRGGRSSFVDDSTVTPSTDRTTHLNEIPAKWLKIAYRGSPPSPRYYHTSTIIENKLYVFGGKGSDSIKNQLYTLDLDTYYWNKLQVTGKIPPHRYGHSAVSFENQIYVYGGVGSGDKVFNDFFFLTVDYRNVQWEQILQPENSAQLTISAPLSSSFTPSSSCNPTPRAKMTQSPLPNYRSSVIFANARNWPPPLAFHSSCVINGVIYIYGGLELFNTSKQSGNTSIWAFHIYQQYWEQIHILPSFHSCHMFSSYVNDEGEIVIVGGQVSRKYSKNPVISVIDLETLSISTKEYYNRESLSTRSSSISLLQRNTLSAGSLNNLDRVRQRDSNEICPFKLIFGHAVFHHENCVAIIGGINQKKEISPKIYIYDFRACL